MNQDDKDECSALVVGFLTSSLKENPSGFELSSFERLFPEKTDEPVDWYKRYGVKSALDAVRQLGSSVRVIASGGRTFISLNTNSDKVDQHLVDLVKNQRGSSKRRRPPARPHSQKVLDSFAINRGYSSSRSSYSNRSNNHYRSRLNGDFQQRSHNQFVESRPGQINAPRPTIYKESVRAAPGDPRARQTSSSQVRPTPPPSQANSGLQPPPTKQQPPFGSSSVNASENRKSLTSNLPTGSSRPVYQISSVPDALRAHEARLAQPPSPPSVRVDPIIEERRLLVKQKLLHLLNRKHPVIKLLYLRDLYQNTFEEPLDPLPLGFNSLTEMYHSFGDSIQINYKGSLPTISAVLKPDLDGKENVASKSSNNSVSHSSGTRDNSFTQNTSSVSLDPSDNKENAVRSGRAKYNAIDPFNVTTMLQSLEPLRQVKEPPLGSNMVEDVIKYRTMRVIFKSPELTLNLDDWERKYQQEWNCSGKIQLREYGFKTLLQFFKHLALELPIKIRLKDDQWIASGDWNSLSAWMKKQISAGRYRAYTVIDAKYEHIAFLGDKYNYLDYKGLQQKEYYKDIMKSVTSADKMWLKMGEQEKFDENISFETTSSCYDDYKRKGFFSLQEDFIKDGFPCAAFDEMEQRWCRAIIVKPPEKIDDSTMIPAFMVDYANKKDFSRKNLLCILKNHLKHPVSQL